MLKGWFCGYCFAAIPQYPSLALYIVFLLYFFFYLYLSHPIFFPCLSFFLCVFPFLCRPRSQPRSDRSAQVFYSQNPPLPKHCLLMTGSYEAARNTFQGCQHPCLDWLVLLKHTHRRRQAHNFICPLNLWLRHIKIKMTVCIKAEPGGESLFSQTWLNTRLRCLQSWDWQ